MASATTEMLMGNSVSFQASAEHIQHVPAGKAASELPHRYLNSRGRDITIVGGLVPHDGHAFLQQCFSRLIIARTPLGLACSGAAQLARKSAVRFKTGSTSGKISYVSCVFPIS